MVPVANLLTVELADGEDERPATPTTCSSCPGVESVELRGATLRIGVRDLSADSAGVLQWLAERGHPFQHLASERASLETVFLTSHRKEPARLMLIPFLALMRKDLRLFFADRRAVMMSVVAPIAIASFFGYIFGGGAGNGDTSRIAVLVAIRMEARSSRDL